MDIINNILKYIVQPSVGLLMAVAALYFLWGVFKFVQNSDNPEKRLDGGRHIIWGVIGLAIMLSVFGLVRIITNTIGPSSYHVTSF